MFTILFYHTEFLTQIPNNTKCTSTKWLLFQQLNDLFLERIFFYILIYKFAQKINPLISDLLN